MVFHFSTLRRYNKKLNNQPVSCNDAIKNTEGCIKEIFFENKLIDLP
jgi:hypothetical protein